MATVIIETAVAVAVVVQGAGFSFWLGALSNEVKNLKADAAKRDSLNDTVIRLEVVADQTEKTVTKLAAAVEGIQRQLANLMQKGIRHINEG